MELKTYFAQDPQGNIIPATTVYLYTYPDGTALAEGLQDANGAPLPNPFNVTSPSGTISLAAPDGNYVLRVSGAGREQRMRVRFIDAATYGDKLAAITLQLTELADNVAAVQAGLAGKVSGTDLAAVVAGTEAALAGKADVAAIRENLTGNRTYYVRPDGNDANLGLADVPGAAFATVQRAYRAAMAVDCNGYLVTIRIADGTYTGGMRAFGRLRGIADSENLGLRIIGNELEPDKVILSAGGADAFQMGDKATALLAGVELRTTTSGDLINLRDNAQLSVRNVRLGSCARGMIVTSNGSRMRAVGPVAVVGSAQDFCHPTTKSLIDFNGQTLTFAEGVGFSNYLYGINDATVSLASATIEGRAATGRVFVHIGGILNVSSCGGIWTGSTAPEVMTGGLIAAESQMEFRALFVRTDGNNANDGFSNTPTGALKTVGAAINRVASFTNTEVVDPSDVGWTINIGPGTYDEVVVMRKMPHRLLKLIGAGSGTSGFTQLRTVENSIPGTLLEVRNLVTLGGTYGIVAETGAEITFANVRFSTATFAHIAVVNGSLVRAIGNYSISSNAQHHIYLATGSKALVREQTVTISNNPNFGGSYIYADRGSVIRSDGMTFTGSAAGKRFELRTNGIIDTSGASETAYLPGNALGTKVTGGLFV